MLDREETYPCIYWHCRQKHEAGGVEQVLSRSWLVCRPVLCDGVLVHCVGLTVCNKEIGGWIDVAGGARQNNWSRWVPIEDLCEQCRWPAQRNLCRHRSVIVLRTSHLVSFFHGHDASFNSLIEHAPLTHCTYPFMTFKNSCTELHHCQLWGDYRIAHQRDEVDQPSGLVDCVGCSLWHDTMSSQMWTSFYPTLT